jgi:hypothetical protein
MFRSFGPDGSSIDALVLNALAINDPVRFKSFIDDMENLAAKSIKNIVDKKEFETLLVDVETRLAKITMLKILKSYSIFYLVNFIHFFHLYRYQYQIMMISLGSL